MSAWLGKKYLFNIFVNTALSEFLKGSEIYIIVVRHFSVCRAADQSLENAASNAGTPLAPHTPHIIQPWIIVALRVHGLAMYLKYIGDEHYGSVSSLARSSYSKLQTRLALCLLFSLLKIKQYFRKYYFDSRYLELITCIPLKFKQTIMYCYMK